MRISPERRTAVYSGKGAECLHCFLRLGHLSWCQRWISPASSGHWNKKDLPCPSSCGPGWRDMVASPSMAPTPRGDPSAISVMLSGNHLFLLEESLVMRTLIFAWTFVHVIRKEEHYTETGRHSLPAGTIRRGERCMM